MHVLKVTSKEHTVWNPSKALFPLFQFARLLGLFPYDRNWESSSFWPKYSSIALLIPIASGIHQIIYGFTTTDPIVTGKTFNVVFHDFRAISEGISSISFLINSAKNAHILSTILRHLRVVRQEKPTTVAKFFGTFAIVNFFAGMFLMNYQSPWTCNFNKRVMITGVNLTNTCLYVATLLYCAILEIAASDFHKLNEKIVTKSANLQAIIRDHRRLNDICVSINRYFSVHLLAHCTRCAVTIVQDIHLVIQMVLSPPSPSILAFTVAAALQGCQECYYLLLITNYSDFVRNEIEVTSYLLRKSTVTQTAANFVVLNRQLFTSMLGGCINYLAIVVQLSRTGQ